MTMRATLIALLLASAAVSMARDDADATFAKLQAVKMPAFDQARYAAEKEKYVKEYQAAVKKSQDERSRLILDFYKEYPEDARVPDLMVERWSTMYSGGAKPEVVLKEIDGVAKATKAEPMMASVDYMRIVLRMGEGEKYDLVKAIKDFHAAHKDSKRYEDIIMRSVFEAPTVHRKAIIEMFVKDFPDHKFVAMFKGQLRQMDAVGKPFELAFDDAINGKKVDMKDFKGKVVMIDWWATWCGPCVAELPHVKEIYKKYKDQGFEIVGVSLDNPEEKGGLKSLKDFVAKNDMPWPQYYQGNGWDSTFSSGWGIMSIPNVFLVDKEGILREIEVANLEESLKKLLAKS
jgi:thiol-disulfide isomerase/thioredoxin